MAKKTLEDCPPETLADQVVVVRVDYNLPLNIDGEVVDDTRLVRTLPTIQYLVEAGAKAVLLSHLGRPGGRPDPALSLRPVAGKLEEFLGYPVGFCPMTTGPQAQEAVQGMKSGEVLLLENTRFCPEDARNDAEWAEEISFGTKLFVNDAFGTAHRAHASTQGVAAAVTDLLATAQKISQVDEGRQFRGTVDAPRGMVHGDGLLELIGQVPALRQPAANIRMGHAQDLLLRLTDVEVLLAHDAEHLGELDREILAEDESADVVQDAGGEGFSRHAVAQLARQQTRSHAAGDGMLPEFLPVELVATAICICTGEPLENRHAEAQVLHRLEAEDDDGVLDGRSVLVAGVTLSLIVATSVWSRGKARVLAFEDMGMEAIYEFEVEDMPVTVAVDSHGESVHTTGPAQWQTMKRV